MRFSKPCKRARYNPCLSAAVLRVARRLHEPYGKTCDAATSASAWQPTLPALPCVRHSLTALEYRCAQMKHFVLSLLVLVLLLCGLTVGASFLLKSTVEDMTREAIMSMAGPGESALEDVTFSPLTREITITGWRTRYRTPSGPVSAHTPTVRGEVPFRCIFACMPVLGNLINNADTMVPVIDNLKTRDLVWSSADRHVTIAQMEIGSIRLRYGLLQQYTLGLRPPFAQAVNGVRIDQMRGSRLTIVLPGPANAMQFEARQIDIPETVGPSAKSCTFTDVTWTLPGQVLTSREVAFHDIRISSALLSELVALSSGRPRTPRANEFLVEALVANGPLVGRASLKGLERKSADAPLALDSCELVWADDKPLEVTAHVRGLKIPSQVVAEGGIPVILEGMDSLIIEADLVSSGISTARESGLVRIRDLADISYSFDIEQTTLAVNNLEISLRDYGLAARTARTISPDAHASGMILKASAGSLCQGDRAEHKVTCEKLADFIDMPGTITLRQRREVPPQTLLELALNVVSARLGSFFEAEVTPGAATLTSQTERLFAR